MSNSGQQVGGGEESTRKSPERKEKTSGVGYFESLIRKLPFIDKNLDHTEKLLGLKGSESPIKQKESILYLQSQLTNILVKLKGKNEKINLSKIRPQNLTKILRVYGVTPTLGETTAIDTLERVLGEGGETAEKLENEWSGIVSASNEATEGFGNKIKGYSKKYLERLKEKPLETLTYTIAGAAGIYLGYKFIKWMVGRSISNAKLKAKSKISEIFSPTNIMIGLALGGAGLFFGRHKLMALLYEKFGIELGAKKFDEIADLLKKGIIPKELDEMAEKIKKGELVNAAVVKAMFGDRPIPPEIQKALKDDGYVSLHELRQAKAGLAQRAKEKALRAKEFAKEKTVKYTMYKNFIKGINPNLNVRALLFANIANQPYESFLKKYKKGSDDFLSLATKIYQKYDKKDLSKGDLDSLVSWGLDDLPIFFTTMLKNKGDFPEFKGKTVEQVMDMIVNNTNKYVDKDAAKEANEKNPHWDKLKGLLFQLGSKDRMEKLKDVDFMSDFVEHSAMLGFTWAVSKAKDGIVLVFKNGIPILTFESTIIYNGLNRIADHLYESDELYKRGLGGYLKIGAAGTTAIGASIGTGLGFLKNIRFGPTAGFVRGAIGGGLKGAGKGFLFPGKMAAKGLKMVLIDMGIRKINPITELKNAVNEKIMFMVEDININPIIHGILQKPFIQRWIKMKSLTDKIKDGDVVVNEKMMKRLIRFKEDVTGGLGKIRVRRNSALILRSHYDKYIGRYEATRDEIEDLLLLLWDKKNGKFLKLEEGSEIFKRMKGVKPTEELITLCNTNRRVAVLLTQKSHPLTQLLTKSTPGQTKRLMLLLGKRPKLIDKILSHPQILDDPKVLEAFGNGVMDFKKAVEGASATIEAQNPGVLTRIKNGILRLTRSDADKVLENASSDLAKVEKGVAKASKTLKSATTTADVAKAQKELTRFQKAREALKKLIVKLRRPKGAVKFTKAKDGFARAPFKAADNSAAIASIKSRLGIVKKGVAKASQQVDTATSVASVAKAKKELTKLQRLRKSLSKALSNFRQPKSAAKLAQAEGGFIEIPVKEVSDATEAVEAVGKTSKVTMALKGLGIAASVFGAGVSIYKTGSHAYEAFTTDIEGRASIEGSVAALWGVNATADVAGLAALLGAKTAVVQGASKLAAPLIPIMYAGETIYDTVKEENLTEAEWAQKSTYDNLIHHWFSTVRSVSLGDAWITGFGADTIDESIGFKKKTMHKIYKVLVAIQSNPEILPILYSDKLSSSEKTKQLQAAIDQSYTKYHEYYFQNEGPALVGNFDSAQKFISNACMFNQVMVTRDKLKKGKKAEFKLGKINLLEDKYEITGTKTNPKAKRPFSPSQIVDIYKKEMVESIKPEIRNNLDKMETSYLLLLYVQMGRLIGAKQAKPDEIAFMEDNTQLIRLYLQSKRGINMTIAMQNPEFFKSQMNFSEIKKHLDSFESEGAGKYKEFEQANVEKSPGVYAMYKLAQYFGYSGNQKEEDLKQFFSEDKAGMHGVYWDGGEWCVHNASGGGFDEGMDETKLNKSCVEKIIKELYESANYILKHRQDTIFAAAFDYTYQVEGMAILLQTSYNEGVNKYNTKGKKISRIAANPKSFKTKKFEEGGDIIKQYDKEIERLSNAAGWSKLDHKVIDENTIEVKRSDTSEKTVIKKSGDKWSLEKNYATGLTFEQAITLSNVLNFTKKIAKEGKWEGGADRPFQVDGRNIDFDRAGMFKMDTTLIDGNRKGNWMEFMNKVGISHQKLVDVLNGWYVAEYNKVAA